METNENSNVSEQITTTTPPTTTACNESGTATAESGTNSNDEFAKEQPDPDNIKMFVGQIPKTLDEIQLKKMFEQFGRVHTINVLRDKVTGVSKGKN